LPSAVTAVNVIRRLGWAVHRYVDQQLVELAVAVGVGAAFAHVKRVRAELLRRPGAVVCTLRSLGHVPG
jgi:hypothetical protein